MIGRLELSDYGKFRRQEFAFGPFTVVTGANEAGKTTIFDAIFDAVCAGSRHEGRPAWKNLAGRYGAIRKAGVAWAEGSPPVELSDDEFLEIFAVRAGDMNVNAAGGGTWESVAEAKLLSSGLNPAQISAALIAKAESSRKDSVKTRVKALNKTLTELQPELAELKGRRDAIFAGEAEMRRLEEDLQARGAAIAEKQAGLKVTRDHAEEIELACRLASANVGIKALIDLKEVRGELAKLVKFTHSELPAYRALLAEARERERAAEQAGAALGEKKTAAAALKADLDALVARQPVLAKQRSTAGELMGKLNAFVTAPPRLVRSVMKPARFGIWAAGAALAAFVAYSGGNTGAYAAAGFIVIASIWIGVKLSIKETPVGRSAEETKGFLDGLAAEWTTVSDIRLPADNADAARDFLTNASAEAAAALESLRQKSEEQTALEGAIKAVDKTCSELGKESEAAAERAAGWLRERGCATEDEYNHGLAEHMKYTARAGDLMERVLVFKERLQCASDDEIRDRLYMEKEALDRKGVDPAKADEPELERLRAREAQAQEEIRAMETEAAKVSAELDRARAVAGARLEGLPERINRAETAIAASRAGLAELDLQQRGYMLASEVFNKLAERSTAAFDMLGREVTATLAKALPGLQAQFVSFDAAEASMTDAAGKPRPAKYLSSGTRDLFMLAARLTMARKARLGEDGRLQPGLLVLDEPFYMMDHRRTAAALQLLSHFQAETGWQIIVLTKDFTLADTAREIGLSITPIDLP